MTSAAPYRSLISGAVVSLKKSLKVSMPAGNRHFGNVGGRLHTQDLDPRFLEILEHGTVVTGDFHDPRTSREAETPLKAGGQVFRMAMDQVGGCGEVDVLLEQRIGGNYVTDLHETALIAEIDIKGIERLIPA